MLVSTPSGDHGKIERARQAHDRGDDGVRVPIDAKIGDEGAVDLGYAHIQAIRDNGFFLVFGFFVRVYRHNNLPAKIESEARN